MTFSKTRIFIVDDHPLVREWLRVLLHQQSDLEVSGQAEDASGALVRPRAPLFDHLRHERFYLFAGHVSERQHEPVQEIVHGLEMRVAQVEEHEVGSLAHFHSEAPSSSSGHRAHP